MDPITALIRTADTETDPHTGELLAAPRTLTPQDHIRTTGGRGMDGLDLPYAMGFTLHLYPETPIHVRLHQHEHRAVIQIGHVRAESVLFADAGQIDRLATLFAHVRDQLA